MQKSCRFAAIVVLGLLGAAAAVMAAREMAGALNTPLETAPLLTFGLATVVAAIIVRLGWLLPPDVNRARRLDLMMMVATTVAAVGLCKGVCSPRNSPMLVTVLLPAVVLTEEGWAWLWFVAQWRRSAASPARASCQLPMRKVKTPDPFILQQQLIRGESEDGAEVFSGSVRLAFAPAQRTGSVHVAFCPPLRTTPTIEVLQVEGPEARVKLAQLLPYGARFDLKLAATSQEPTAVVLEFTARGPSGNA
jgi:hypothetical protein